MYVRSFDFICSVFFAAFIFAFKYFLVQMSISELIYFYFIYRFVSFTLHLHLIIGQRTNITTQGSTRIGDHD